MAVPDKQEYFDNLRRKINRDGWLTPNLQRRYDEWRRVQRVEQRRQEAEQAERDRLEEERRLIEESRPPPIPERPVTPPPPANPPIDVPPPPKKPENNDLIIGYPKPPTPPVTGYPVSDKYEPAPIPPEVYDEVLVPVNGIRYRFENSQPNFLERIISWLQSLFRN